MNTMADVKAGFAEINGAKIYYEVAGAGYLLVFVHAGIADSRMWDGQFQAFAERYQVMRYDQRGFGKTAMVAGEYSHVQDLHGLLDYLKIDHACFVGCSMGGRVITDLVLEYPKMVDALVLVGAAFSGYQYQGTPLPELERIGQEIDEAEEAGDLARVNELEIQVWVDGLGKPPTRVNPAVRELVRDMNLIALSSPQVLGNEREPLNPAVNRLGEIHVPTLVIIGDLDIPASLERTEILVHDIAGAKKVVMPNTAHVPNMEQPDIFNRHVLAFLSKI
jgi:pimeloyl-ACP methyl ester carboxylesterase